MCSRLLPIHVRMLIAFAIQQVLISYMPGLCLILHIVGDKDVFHRNDVHRRTKPAVILVGKQPYSVPPQATVSTTKLTSHRHNIYRPGNDRPVRTPSTVSRATI
jgi:hypothetical protein